MAVDIRGIEVALVKTVREFIGSKLSTIGKGANEKASVIRSRLYSVGSREVTPTFPDYPYASVDYTRITDEGYELTQRFFDDNGNYVYQTHKIASYSIKFFGTSKDDVLSLCNEMHMLFEVDSVRDRLSALSPTEARVRSKSDPVFISSAMEDKYREIASFDLMLAVLDEVSVTEDVVGYFQNIDMDTSRPVGDIFDPVLGGDTVVLGYEQSVLTGPFSYPLGGLFYEGSDTPALHVKVKTNITPSN